MRVVAVDLDHAVCEPEVRLRRFVSAFRRIGDCAEVPADDGAEVEPSQEHIVLENPLDALVGVDLRMRFGRAELPASARQALGPPFVAGSVDSLAPGAVAQGEVGQIVHRLRQERVLE